MRFSDLLQAHRPLIMGIVNVTPDSFSDGGEFLDPGIAVAHAGELLAQGADILDIGGVSTRPPGSVYGTGAVAVSEDEELRRVLPVIQKVVTNWPSAVLSIDTTNAVVASEALKAGVDVINDVSAGTSDLRMFDVASLEQAPIILMHGYGPRFNLESLEQYRYDNVVKDVFSYLKERILVARKCGIQQILADPGMGFSKKYPENLQLLKGLRMLEDLAVPVVFGVSRKFMIGRAMLESMGLKEPPAPKERVMGGLAAATYAVVKGGARIVRTHDVRVTKEAFSVLEALERVA